MRFNYFKLSVFDIATALLRRRDLICYGVILLSCFLLFQQTDLYYTSASSYAYLNGHFVDFYDYNKPIFGGSDYFPLLYVIMALWNLPLKIFGLTTDVSLPQAWMGLSVIEIIWIKLLLVLFFYATAVTIYKIGEIITEGARSQARLATGLFITAPIAIFAVFIFGQYDIIGLFFTMVGFYYYVRKDLSRFAWFLSIAISFKFFPLAIFFPLILLAEKRLLHLVKFGFIAVTVPALQILLYWGNSSFREGIFVAAAGKAANFASLRFSPLNDSPVILVVYFVICLFAFIYKPESEAQWRKVAILTVVAVYGVMFSTVIWHPQWLIIIVPFFSLATLYIKDKSKSYAIDVLGMLAFVWVVVNIWVRGVDVAMLHYGAFGRYFASFPLVNADLMSVKFVPIFQTLFFIYLFSPLLVIAFQSQSGHQTCDQTETSKSFKARFLVGISVFVIPSLMCVWTPKSVVLLFSPRMYLSYLKPGLVLDVPRVPVGEIIKGGIVSQTFRAEHDKLSAVAVDLATYARVNNCSVKLSLQTAEGVDVSDQTLDCKGVLDNTFYVFAFLGVSGSEGKTFRISISSSDAKPGNAITAWMNESDIYKNGRLSVNGVQMPGALMIKLFYER